MRPTDDKIEAITNALASVSNKQTAIEIYLVSLSYYNRFLQTSGMPSNTPTPDKLTRLDA